MSLVYSVAGFKEPALGKIIFILYILPKNWHTLNRKKEKKRKKTLANSKVGDHLGSMHFVFLCFWD